jgi:hypothetical protein
MSKSEIYTLRKHHLISARIYAFFLMTCLLVFLLSAHLVEAWVVRYLLDRELKDWHFLLAILCVFLALGVYTFAHSRFVLHIAYRIDNLRMARTLLLSSFLIVYLVVVTSLKEIPVLVPVAVAKIYSAFLFFRFWESQIKSFRVRHKELAHPRAFLVSMKAFLVCRWIVCACWFLVFFGFALSLISSDPVIAMSGLESVCLLGAFYILFRIFVRNPLAHPKWNEMSPLKKA